MNTADALERRDTEHRRELKGLLDAITEALDSFARVLGAETPLEHDSVRLIERQLLRALQEAGAAPIGVVGETAEPETHKIIDTRPAGADAHEDEVLEVLRLGCRYHDQVMRPAEVIVAVAPPPTATDPDDTAPTATDEESR